MRERRTSRLHGTFTGHSEGDPLTTSDATFDLTWSGTTRVSIHEPLAFEIESGSFTFSTDDLRSLRKTLQRGWRPGDVPGRCAAPVYGDPAEEQRRTASAQILDMRADGGGVSFALAASITLPGNGDPSCEPPFEPYG